MKTVEATSMKFCTILKLVTLLPEKTTMQVKCANFSHTHAQTFVLLNGEMAIVSTCFRKLKFWLWLQSVFWSLAEFCHNKIVQLLRENCFNVCRQLQRKVRSGKHDV